MTFSGWVATLAGWIVTEVGRQPWLVTGLLRTKDAVGQATGAQLGASLTGYILTYSALFIAYMIVLTHMAGKGATPDDDPAVAAQAAVPIARAAE
jgi:cytochrome d ubiquinol oxidase subunit I